MKTLICCLGDLINYTSALHGMNPEKQRVMSNSYHFMPGWFKELGRLAEHITDILDKIRFPNIVPNETRNGEDKEDESRQQRRNPPPAESTS